MPQPTSTAPATTPAVAPQADTGRVARREHIARIRTVLTLARHGLLDTSRASVDLAVADALAALNVKAPDVFRSLEHYAAELVDADHRADELAGQDAPLENYYDDEELARGIRYHHGRAELRQALADEADDELDRLIGMSLPAPVTPAH